MLTVSDVSKRFGQKTVLEHINLDFDCGLYGLLAPNGAGKTTLIKMVTTQLFPTEGEILYDGVNIRSLGADYRALIGYLPQQFGYYRGNTPARYLDYLAALKGMPKKGLKERIRMVLEEVGLEDQADVKMGRFSGGMLQRVGIAQAILDNPKILILDEPTAGLDPKERVRFRNILSSLAKDRIVILSTHIVSDIESAANRVIMLRSGRVERNDTVASICSGLEGCIREVLVPDADREAFGCEHLVLSERQDRQGMTVRFYAEKGHDTEGRACTPNLEDVFLVTYR